MTNSESYINNSNDSNFWEKPINGTKNLLCGVQMELSTLETDTN